MMANPGSHSLVLSPDEAFEVAVQRDPWIWVKAPVWLLLGIFYFAESIWKAGTLLVGCFACQFVEPCIAGEGITEAALWIAFLFRFFLTIGIAWYAAYTLAWLSLPGLKFKAASAIAIVAFPFLLIMSAVLGTLAFEALGVPMERIFLFEQRYVPFESWKGTH